MSSSFSMANQKIKEFFGASQTKDFNLEVQRDTHESGSNKLNNFIQALKYYYEVMASLPKALERLYCTFGELSPKEIYYDGAEYRSNYYSIIEDAKVKANSIYERYSFIQRQLHIQEEHIKKLEKEFQEARQRYDHYKTKVEKLTNQFSTLENPKAYKTAKEQLDRNILKLTNSEMDYNRELSKMRARLQNYQMNFSDIAFSCFELHSDDLCEFIISSARHATSIKQFVASKRAKCRSQNLTALNPIPIQNLFSKPRIDFFPQIQNKFMNTNHNIPMNLSPNPKSNSPSKPSSGKKQIPPDMFNFFSAEKPPKPNQTQSTTLTSQSVSHGNQSTDLLGLM